jgi:hypothetical protein
MTREERNLWTLTFIDWKIRKSKKEYWNVLNNIHKKEEYENKKYANWYRNNYPMSE